MADDKRLNFDDHGDLSSPRNDLLKDVAEATRLAKLRTDSDKAKDRKMATKGRDRTLMLVVVIIAALALIGVAYSVVGRDKNQAQQSQNRIQPGVTSSTVTPPATYRPTIPQTNRPAPVQPPSEPVRRTPTDTYEQGPGHQGGM